MTRDQGMTMDRVHRNGAGPRASARRFLLGAAGFLALLAPAAQAQLLSPIGFETCASGAALSDVTCAGIATLSTPSGAPVAVAFDGRFGSAGAIGLYSDRETVTITFSPTVSQVQVNVLAPDAGATMEAFDAGGASLGSTAIAVATVTTAQLSAAGIARIEVRNPAGEFGLDELQTAPEGALPGCPVYQDGCAVDVCTVPFFVGGDVIGLDAGESLTLQLNGADDLVISADGAFQFPTVLGHDRTYDVTVSTQPTNESCSVVAGTGTIDDADIDDVQVLCGPPRSIGGTLSGLAAGASVTLQNNGGNDLVLTANGAFVFPAGLPDGQTYSASVLVQPTAPAQICTVTGGSGTVTADVTTIAVNCVTQSFAVGGTLSGLAAGNSVTLSNNGGDAITLSADGSFAFPTPVLDLGAYAVAVTVQPTSPNQTCSVASGNGNVAGGPVTTVAVSCVTDNYTVGGTVSGLAAGNDVVLLNNGGDALGVSANGSFTFATALADGSAYDVTVQTQPGEPDQICTIANGSGALAGGNVTAVSVSCVTQTHSVAGTVSGLASGNSVTLTNNGGDTLVVSADGAFAFTSEVDDGGAYDVAVSVQPTSPNQTCSVANGTGSIDGEDIATVAVACVTTMYTIGGSVSGLAAGNGVTLTNNGGDALVISADGSFTFATALDDGSAYEVAVSLQPTDPDQTCTVSTGSGTLAGANVTDVVVNCATETFTIGGTIAGLAAGNSVTLTNNGGDALVVSADGSFTFATPLDDGAAYAAAVSVQPTSPNQTCSIANGAGNVDGANVTAVAVTCVTTTYTIGGTVSGLAAGNSVTLTNNSGDALVVSADGAFTFATALDDGSAYVVAVSLQPTDPDQTCTVSAGNGTLAGANVASVVVSCATDVFTVGGTLFGLAPGNTVTLTNNGGDALVLSANGSFAFATSIADGAAYAVAVSVQPTSPNQTCSVANGTGTVEGASVTAVAVTCVTTTYTVGGTVSGLAAGNSVTLTNNSGDALVISADGTFTFATALDDGSAYAVAVSLQPTDPDQTCMVSAGNGTLAGANVANVVVNCATDTYTIGGTIAGLAAGNSVTLTNNGGDALVVSADGSFTFATPLDDGAAYAAAVSVQPTSPNQTCSVANGAGTVDRANVTNVSVTCVTTTYTIGGTVSGLAAGNSVTLTNNAGDALAVSADGAFTFAAALDDGSAYTVAVSLQPTDPDQTCTVSAGTGTLAGANVANVSVNCSTATFMIGGTVAGLAAGNSVTLTNNGGDALVVSADGSFAFTAPLDDGAAYAVAVSVQPTSPNQICSVANGAGTVDGANVTNVAVTCVTTTYTIGGTVSGLEPGNSVTLTNNGGDALVVSTDGAFTFATAIDDGSAYAVAVSLQPTDPDQTCTVSAANGTLAGANVANVVVNCATAMYTIGGTLSGLAAGNAVTLTNNGGDALVLSADGSFAFATSLGDGAAYDVAVSVQPTTPNQACSVANGVGTVDGANVTSVAVTCVTTTYGIGGTVSGLDAGNSLTLTNNGGDALAVSANGAFAFATQIGDGGSYAVAIAVQPANPAQTCVVSGGSGTVQGADVTTVAVACDAATFVVTPAAGLHGALDPATAQTVSAGATATFTVTPDLGYEIGAVSGCGGILGGTQYVTGAIAADCTVTASFVKRVITGTTPGGAATASVAGDWVFAPAGNGAAQSAGFIPTTGHPKSPPPAPANLSFPQGLIDFVLVEGAAGSAASVQLVFPQPIPANAQFWVYGPTADQTAPHWHALAVTFAGNTMQLPPIDGGAGDGDLTANAAIPFVGGMVVVQGTVTTSSPLVIPVSSPWTLSALAMLVLLLALGFGRTALAPSRE